MKNRWHIGFTVQGQAGRDITAVACALIIMFGIFAGARWSLGRIYEYRFLLYFPPSQSLGIVLVFLFIMLVISNMVAALGSLFFSKDLDLILASPVSVARIFFGKFGYIFISSSWMPCIFAFPLFLAFGESYHHPIAFYGASIAALLPYFAIPSALAIIVSACLPLLIPSNWIRGLYCLVFIVVLTMAYLVVDVMKAAWLAGGDVSEIFRFLSVLSFSHTPWLPSSWVAVCLQELLEPSGKNAWLYIMILYCTAIGLMAFAYIILEIFYLDSFSKAQTIARKSALPVGRRKERSYLVARFFSPPTRAFFMREYVVLARDMIHIAQFVMLAGLCVIYLYNLKILSAFRSLPGASVAWWERFLFICTAGMGAFVTTAVCTRFVFPSLSLEGRSLWVLQTAPLEIGRILRLKFWCWFYPVAIISSAVFAIGALVIGTGTPMMFMSIVVSWLISYGLVGLAIGFGALFSYFEWEHASELSAGFGNFLFMLAGAMLVFLNMVLFWIVLFWRPASLFGGEHAFIVRVLFMVAGGAFMVYVNGAAAREALQRGTLALQRKLE